LATRTLWQKRAATMRVTFVGTPGASLTAKDMILALIGRIGAGGATGHSIDMPAQRCAHCRWKRA
jgi:3-isopropylmalate/(R)-2-methylmalate dehydratase large subunit